MCQFALRSMRLPRNPYFYIKMSILMLKLNPNQGCPGRGTKRAFLHRLPVPRKSLGRSKVLSAKHAVKQSEINTAIKSLTFLFSDGLDGKAYESSTLLIHAAGLSARNHGSSCGRKTSAQLILEAQILGQIQQSGIC